jgi:DNA-binding IclR family transcriptional regulator
MTDKPEYAVEATGTSLTILETLVEAGKPLGVTALSDRVGIAKSVSHNHLSTLRSRGFVTKWNGRYEPSLRALALGDRAREWATIHEEAKPSVDNLADATRETTTLFVLEGNRGVPAYVTEDVDDWSPAFRAGERMPLHVNAPGKAILASLPDERVEEILNDGDLAAPTDATVTDPGELWSRISRIRDDGISFCKEEQIPDVVGVAAPIQTADRSRPAAIGVMGPVDRLHGRYLEEDVTGQVLSTSKAIQIELASK